MAYTTTTQEWFATAVPAFVHSAPDVSGPVLFDIEGDGGGAWTVDFQNKTVTPGKGAQPKVIVRACERDFMALVEGRMSADDGIVTKRLHVAGDVVAIAQLMTSLAKLRA